ncbi:branched-chain-amino-acid aminotransferase [Colletotrichum tofieldiae]|uniref:Branched-chain-amino-acid aminotransferase n=1 Tax=Colletotrichum tofieldiae TaxID=708197 RepID=A0A166P1V7_9PEZI|nr:branched-chain-amino-acid aminotransferase [Colletotrichum tofieldiae]
MYTADEYTFAVLVTPVGLLYGGNGLKALVVEGFDRTAPRGTGAFKVGGNYGSTIRVMGRARQHGYGLTLHLDSETQSFVHEFSASGFVGVKKNPLDSSARPTIVIPKDEHILPSITVDSVGKIAEDLGWNVERRPYTVSVRNGYSERY